jgi:hypothetical protein
MIEAPEATSPWHFHVALPCSSPAPEPARGWPPSSSSSEPFASRRHRSSMCTRSSVSTVR